MSKRRRLAKRPPPTTDEQIIAIERRMHLRWILTKFRLQAIRNSGFIYAAFVFVDWGTGTLAWFLFGSQFAAVPLIATGLWIAQVGFALLALAGLFIHSGFTLWNLWRLEMDLMRDEEQQL